MAVGPRIQLPLQRIEAKQQYDHRVVLVGNAARLLHPVAGQGYNLAVRDIAALVDALDGAQDVSHVPLGMFVQQHSPAWI